MKTKHLYFDADAMQVFMFNFLRYETKVLNVFLHWATSNNTLVPDTRAIMSTCWRLCTALPWIRVLLKGWCNAHS